jgi:hypothetical protein
MTDQNVSIQTHHRMREKATLELKRFLEITLYLWVVFGLMSIHKSVILSQEHLDYPEQTFAIVNALIFAKVLLVAEAFHLGTRFTERPLIYPILYKCLIFTLVILGFHYGESILVGVLHGKAIANSLPQPGGGSPKVILSLCAMSFMLLLPLFGFEEVGRVIGYKELRDLFLEPRASDPKLTPSSRQ